MRTTIMACKACALGCAAVVLVSACASSPPKPPTPTEMLMGTWSCESAIGPASLKLQPTYLPDGKATFALQVSGGTGGMTVEAAGTGQAAWKLLEGDTKLEQTLSNVTVTSATLNGQTIDPGMAQSMIGPYIAGQAAVATMAITPTTLTLTAPDATTNCTRPAK